MISNSTRWTINGIDVWKSIRTGLVFSLATFITYALDSTAPAVVQGLAQKYAFFTPIMAIIIELIRRWASDHSLQKNGIL